MAANAARPGGEPRLLCNPAVARQQNRPAGVENNQWTTGSLIELLVQDTLAESQNAKLTDDKERANGARIGTLG